MKCAVCVAVVVGSVIGGKYELLRQIGKGGMGEVYEAICLETQERVAIKLLDATRDKRDEHRRNRFRREANTASAIKSEHVTRIIETGEDEAAGVLYIIMELLQGEDLEKLLQRVRCLKPEIALKIAAQVCVGLVEAHDARIIHRDIKPANLFLDRRSDGEIIVRILDFGIAKTKAEPGADTTGLTRSGSTIGTPLYMSPEQARGLPDISFSTDIWSIGVVLYRCLAGRVPHQGIAAHGDLIIAISTKLSPPLQRFAPWVSPDITALVHRALRLNAEGRYSSAHAMLKAIDAFLPQGRRLDEGMLVPPSEDERATEQMRYNEPTAELERHVVSIADEDRAPHEPTADYIPDHVDVPTGLAVPMQRSTNDVAAPRQTNPPRRVLRTVLGGAIAASLMALGAYKLYTNASGAIVTAAPAATVALRAETTSAAPENPGPASTGSSNEPNAASPPSPVAPTASAITAPSSSSTSNKKNVRIPPTKAPKTAPSATEKRKSDLILEWPSPRSTEPKTAP